MIRSIVAARRIFLAAAGAALLLSTAAAHASRASADACAASLSPNAQAIYNGSVAAIASGANPRDTVTSTVRTMIMNGQIDRNAARTDAQAAATCLEQAKP